MNPDRYAVISQMLTEANNLWDKVAGAPLILDAGQMALDFGDVTYGTTLQAAAETFFNNVMAGNSNANYALLQPLRRMATDKHVAVLQGQDPGAVAPPPPPVVPLPVITAPPAPVTTTPTVAPRVQEMTPVQNDVFEVGAGPTNQRDLAEQFSIWGTIGKIGKGLLKGAGTVLGLGGQQAPQINLPAGLLGGGQVPVQAQGVNDDLIQQILSVLGAGAGQTAGGAAILEAINQIRGQQGGQQVAVPPPVSVPAPGMDTGNMLMLPSILAPEVTTRLKAIRGYRIVKIAPGHPGYADAKRVGGILQPDGSIKIQMRESIARKWRLLPPRREKAITGSQLKRAKEGLALKKKVDKLSKELNCSTRRRR